MLKPIKEVTAIVIDTGGNYIAMAQRLARDYKKVYYCCNWQDGFPTWNQYAIGLNVPDIERVDHWAEVIDECDLVVIPDLYFGSLADWFVKHGWPVFGARLGENMEIYRDEFKELLEQFNLPVNDYEIIQGFTKLKKYLATHEDKWVKTSIIRGNGETFHWNNSRLSESRLDKLQHTLGAFKEEATFVVESAFEAKEVGYDGLIIDGKWPEKCMAGLEKKDAAYFGSVIEFKTLPDALKKINKEFSAFFAGAGYKGFFSNEVRMVGNTGYFTDATCRVAQPPGDLQMEIFENYSEIIWQVAHGIVPEVKEKARYGAQIIIKSDWAQSDPQAIYFPPKYSSRIKIKNLMYKDNLPYFIPGEVEMCEIGSVCACAETPEKAIAEAKKIAESVEGDGISINAEPLKEAYEELLQLKKEGINLLG